MSDNWPREGSWYSPENWDPARNWKDPDPDAHRPFIERNWRDVCDYLLTRLLGPEPGDPDVVQVMQDKPKGEMLEGFSVVSMRLLSQLVDCRAGVVENDERTQVAKRTLQELRASGPPRISGT